MSELDEIDLLVEDLQGVDVEPPLEPAVVERRLGMIKEVEVVVGIEEIKAFMLEELAGLSILARANVGVRARV